ncbi:MAG: ABC transporter ATP-binding protein [Gemmatimonadaceae bacterium]|nr:ABC transporter ATP-binding protein [Gemmatimonadaceae bacterium]
MTAAFSFRGVTKRFGKTTALDGITLDAAPDRIIGLIGKNGSGKSTLLRHVVGLQLPTAGECLTFGVPTPALDAAELSRIGVVHQDDRFLTWMRADQMIRYVGSFYERWDAGLADRLARMLELDVSARIRSLSPGNIQKLAIILAVCHHPTLLLLDEPLSDLDPIAREATLALILERFRSGDMTIVISSHILRDVEQIVDSVICLDRGRLVTHESLDALQERYAEWVLASTDGLLPAAFTEPYVLEYSGNAHQARLVVRDPGAHEADFVRRHGVDVTRRPLNLERIFPLLIDHRRDRSPNASEELAAWR